jgi:hypothetical protein
MGGMSRWDESRWRDGGGTSWPPDHPSRVEPWPKPSSAGFTPARAGPVAVACLRTDGPMVMTTYATPEEAQEHPCTLAGCERQHAVAFCEPGKLHVARGRYDDPPTCRREQHR